MICVPVTSLGIKSGVNWMRLKLRCVASASELTNNVLASPGTPSKSACPRAQIATRTCSITSAWPTITPESSLRIRSKAVWQRSTAARSSWETTSLAMLSLVSGWGLIVLCGVRCDNRSNMAWHPCRLAGGLARHVPRCCVIPCSHNTVAAVPGSRAAAGGSSCCEWRCATRAAAWPSRAGRGAVSGP